MSGPSVFRRKQEKKNCCTGEWKAQWCGHSGGTGYWLHSVVLVWLWGPGRFSSEWWRRLCWGVYRQDKAAYLCPQSITPSTLAMSAMLLMSAGAAGAFGAPPSLTSNEQSQRDTGPGRKGLAANRGSQTHQTRCQAERGEQNGRHPATISFNHPGCSILGHQMSSFKSKTVQ